MPKVTHNVELVSAVFRALKALNFRFGDVLPLGVAVTEVPVPVRDDRLSVMSSKSIDSWLLAAMDAKVPVMATHVDTLTGGGFAQRR